MLALETVEDARQITIDVVFGYLRLQNLNIPKEITLICLKYYNENIEWFSGFRDDCFKVSDDKMKITSIKNCDFDEHSIFGNVWIPSTSKTISKWTLILNAIMPIQDIDGIYFGFASKYDTTSDLKRKHKDYIPNYAVSADAFLYHNV